MGGGDAYEVEVEDMSACTLDPDWSYGLMLEIDAGVWWTAPRARIVRVVERGCSFKCQANGANARSDPAAAAPRGKR